MSSMIGLASSAGVSGSTLVIALSMAPMSGLGGWELPLAYVLDVLRRA